jgi:homoserine O-acetyltransferase
VPIVGTPRLTPQDRLLWRAELRAFRASHPNGRRAAMKAVAAIHGLHLHTPRHLATMDSTAFRTFVAQREKHILAFNPYDWAWQIKAMLRHDVTEPFGGSLSRAATTVDADVLVVTMTQDHMVNPRPARRFAREMGARQLRLDTPCGHLGAGCKADTVQATVHRFLRANQ